MDKVYSSNDFSRPSESHKTTNFNQSARKLSAYPAKRSASPQSGVGHDRSHASREKSEHAQEDYKEDRTKQSQSGRQLLRFIISHLGLILLVVAYVVAGAFLFQLLEQHNEIQRCQKGQGVNDDMITAYRTSLFNYIYFNTTSNPWLPVDNTTTIASLATPRDGPNQYNPYITEQLQLMREEILATLGTYKYWGQDCVENSMWVFPSALLFTMSVVATIGYGHVSPATWEGQIVVICYATLGIPLFLMSIANISVILGDMFRFIYGTLFCRTLRKKRQREAIVSGGDGDGDVSGQVSSGSVSAIKADEQMSHRVSSGRDQNENDEDEDGLTMNKITVPLIFVLATIIGYLTIGGYIFSMLQGWTLIASVYFSYVSLATIGFGDLVPGTPELASGQYDAGQRNLMVAAIYIFLGMSMLAMCFDLMQDEMVEKALLIAHKLGFKNSTNDLGSNDHDDDDDDDDAAHNAAEETEQKMRQLALAQQRQRQQLQPSALATLDATRLQRMEEATPMSRAAAAAAVAADELSSRAFSRQKNQQQQYQYEQHYEASPAYVLQPVDEQRENVNRIHVRSLNEDNRHDDARPYYNDSTV